MVVVTFFALPVRTNAAIIAGIMSSPASQRAQTGQSPSPSVSLPIPQRGHIRSLSTDLVYSGNPSFV